MPVASLKGTVNPWALILVQVGEDAVLVRQVSIRLEAHALLSHDPSGGHALGHGVHAS